MRLTELDDAMLKHMHYLVIAEGRPFSYKDFERFEVDGHIYVVSHGTCRNKFSQFMKKNLIEREYNSKVAFYTLTGHHFAARNTMTRNVMGDNPVTDVTNVTSMKDLFNYLHTIPVKQSSVHDIHYKFTVPDIYKIISSVDKYKKRINPVSKDIVLEPEIIDGFKIQPIVHCTDTVTVSLACSDNPIPVNEAGILRGSIALTRAEERLSNKVDECCISLPGGYEKIPIPDNRRWTVTMWHFGKDGRYEYCRKGFSLTWGYGREVLRIYTKSIEGQDNLRADRQEYPKKASEEAFREKIKQNTKLHRLLN